MAKIVKLKIPNDVDVQAAVGRIAMHHSQLLYVARLTIKTINREPLLTALARTKRMGAAQLFNKVQECANFQYHPANPVCAKIKTLLDRARFLTTERNRMIHDLWASDPSGASILRSNDLDTIGPVPSLKDLIKLGNELAKLVVTLNGARRSGFIYKESDHITA